MLDAARTRHVATSSTPTLDLAGQPEWSEVLDVAEGRDRLVAVIALDAGPVHQLAGPAIGGNRQEPRAALEGDLRASQQTNAEQHAGLLARARRTPRSAEVVIREANTR